MSLEQKRALISPNLTLSLRRQCDLLALARSSMYYEPFDPPERTNWTKLIAEIHAKWPQYGYRKVAIWLNNKGYRINGKKVRRLRRKMGIRSLLPSPRTSIPNREHSVYPYLFKGVEITHANQAWCTDLTYIHLPVGTVYLFCFIDWFSRFIVGWKLAVTMEAEHAVEAFEDGLNKGTPEACNADQGAQYTGEKWVTCLTRHGVQISHTGVGRCIDNVYIERFWWTIKYEDIHLKSYETVEDVRRGIEIFIKYYNEERPHQALNYKTPNEVYFGRKAPKSPPAQQPLGTSIERRAA